MQKINFDSIKSTIASKRKEARFFVDLTLIITLGILLLIAIGSFGIKSESKYIFYYFRM